MLSRGCALQVPLRERALYKAQLAREQGKHGLPLLGAVLSGRPVQSARALSRRRALQVPLRERALYKAQLARELGKHGLPLLGAVLSGRPVQSARALSRRRALQVPLRERALYKAQLARELGKHGLPLLGAVLSGRPVQSARALSRRRALQVPLRERALYKAQLARELGKHGLPPLGVLHLRPTGTVSACPQQTPCSAGAAEGARAVQGAAGPRAGEARPAAAGGRALQPAHLLRAHGRDPGCTQRGHRLRAQAPDRPDSQPGAHGSPWCRQTAEGTNTTLT